MWRAGHFYSPIPDVAKLAREPTRSRVWPPTPHPTPGIDWRDDEQLKLCTKTFARQIPMQLPEATVDPHEYFTTNEQYGALDAWILQAMLRHLRPARMVEIGSGYSSLLAARVNREFLDGGMQLTCIDPNPRDFLAEGVAGISTIRSEEVQDTPLDLFQELRSGDVLFMDTSHTVKTGGEVPWIFSQIIPRLNQGVVVHIHDIFLPGEYPKQWVLEEARYWNEIYLVAAFLTFNSAFEVLFSAQWMLQRHQRALVKAFPGLVQRKINRASSADSPLLSPLSGAALWIRRST